jgi:hypothetical protein
MATVPGEVELGGEERLETGRQLSTITGVRLVWSKVESRRSSEMEWTLMD